MKCSNPDCNYDQDGVCIDGLSEKDCPNLVDYSQIEIVSPDSIEEDDEDKDIIEITPSSKSSKMSFPGQSPLSLEDTRSKLKDRYGKIISFIGPVGVGKTTLISSLYDSFNKPEKMTIAFGGSDTLFAFEKLCHHARVTCRCSKVSTPRTSSIDDVGFYHLSINDSNQKRQDIFLADRSGESYSEMIDNISLVDNYIELIRSDIYLLMVDSSELGHNAKRHKTRRTAQKLFQALSESKILDSNINCNLVLTKFDLVKDKEEERCLLEAKKIVESSQQFFDQEIDIIPISARPEKEKNSTPDLFKELWRKIEKSQQPKKVVSIRKYRSSRSFHNMELTHEC